MTEFIRYLATEFSRKFARNGSPNSVSSLITKTSNTNGSDTTHSIKSKNNDNNKNNKLSLPNCYNTKHKPIHVAHLNCKHLKTTNKNKLNPINDNCAVNINSNNNINNNNNGNDNENYYFFDSESDEKKLYFIEDEYHYFDKNNIKDFNDIDVKTFKKDIDSISLDSSFTNVTTITSTTMNTFNTSPYFNHLYLDRYNNTIHNKTIEEEKIVSNSPNSINYYLDSPIFQDTKKVNKQEYYNYADNFDKYLQESTTYLNSIKSNFNDYCSDDSLSNHAETEFQ